MKTLYTLFAILVSSAMLCGSISYGYDGRNQLINCTYSNGYSITYSYDSNGNIVSQVITIPNTPPLSPTQFSITSNGDVVTLNWDPVTNNINGTPIIVPLYVIEASSDPTTGFTLIGTTNQTQYSVSSYNYQQRFYRVRAVVNYQRDDVQPDVQIDTITTDTRSNE